MPAWIFTVLSELIKETGDISLLDREIPRMQKGGGKTVRLDMVLTHCLRARDYLAGDIGSDGTGESVLVSQIFAKGLNDFGSSSV